ncbi:Clavaminate synthase-like protein [Gautieria morchelliformis]|nr:Clavaminate synthase-like protein [Gautieria morchelliformis]
MPATTFPSAPHYIAPPFTSYDLEWADLAIIDISKAATPEGRAQLSVQVRDALSTAGFFYVVNHGYTPEQTTRMFDIADIPFEQVSQTEKEQYLGQMKQTGSYQGYKLRSYWHVDNGVRDQIENYNVHRDVTKRAHPEALRPFLPEISAFARHNHFNVLHPILRLVALGLELPEDIFVDNHGFDAENDTWVRLMKYYPRTEEDENKTKNLWLKGHTDVGSLTILWSQPVSGLQIKSPDGKWRWIKHIENALVINAGDCLEFLSGGYYKATIHRVVQPPPDQRGYTRLGAFYFAFADDNVRLSPVMDSPVLQRVGVSERFKGDAFMPPTSGEYRKARVAAYGQSELKKGKQDGTEEEVVAGVLVKHYL